MLNRDFTGGIQSAVRNSLGLDFTPAPNKWAQLPQIVSQGIDDWDSVQRKNAYEEALKGGNQEEINQAWAKYDPDGYQRAMQAKEAEEADFNRKVQLMDMQNQKAMELENMRNRNAYGLAAFRNNLARSTAQAEMDNKIQAIDEALASGQITEQQANTAKTKLKLGNLVDFSTIDAAGAEEQSRKQAQDSINQLAGVAQRNNIGVFTDWRRSHGLTGAETEREYGRISSAVAGLAPRAIAKLKEAGVSGINSLPEFMTYIGLPENPTSEQIAGAIPMMAQIAGVDNPLENEGQQETSSSLFGKPFSNNDAPELGVGQTAQLKGFSITRVK